LITETENHGERERKREGEGEKIEYDRRKVKGDIERWNKKVREGKKEQNGNIYE
jgi:hypothetical protein